MYLYILSSFHPFLHPLSQRSPTFLVLGTSFMEDNFSMDGVGREMVLVLPAAHLLLCLAPNTPQTTPSMAQGLGTSPLTHLSHASLVPFLCQAVCVRACTVASVVSNLCDPMDCSLPGSSVPRILQAGIWSGLPYPPPGDLSGPGIKRFLQWQADSLPLAPKVKLSPEDTKVTRSGLVPSFRELKDQSRCGKLVD